MGGYTFPTVDQTIARYQQVTAGPTDRFGNNWPVWVETPNPLFSPGLPASIYLTDDLGRLITDDLGNPIPLNTSPVVPVLTDDQASPITTDLGNDLSDAIQIT